MCPVYFVTHVPGLHPAARNDFGVRPLRRSNIVSAHEFVAPTLGSAMRCLRRSTAQKVNQSSLPLLGGLAAWRFIPQGAGSRWEHCVAARCVAGSRAPTLEIEKRATETDRSAHDFGAICAASCCRCREVAWE